MPLHDNLLNNIQNKLRFLNKLNMKNTTKNLLMNQVFIVRLSCIDLVGRNRIVFRIFKHIDGL